MQNYEKKRKSPNAVFMCLTQRAVGSRDLMERRSVELAISERDPVLSRRVT